MSRRANGEGQVRHRPDGRWEGRYWTQDGQRRSVFGRTKDDAVRKLREAVTARDRGTLAAPSRETIATYLQTWLAGAQPSLRPMTYQSYESIIRTQLEPRIGKVRLTQLRPQHVQRMLADLIAEGFSTKYSRNVHGVLHRALDRAVHWHQLVVNPADGVDLPQPRSREMTALTVDDARRCSRRSSPTPSEHSGH